MFLIVDQLSYQLFLVVSQLFLIVDQLSYQLILLVNQLFFINQLFFVSMILHIPFLSTPSTPQMRDLQTQLTNERGSNASAAQELKESRARIDALVAKISDLEGTNLQLQQKLADMAQAMEDLKSAHRAQMAAKDGED